MDLWPSAPQMYPGDTAAAILGFDEYSRVLRHVRLARQTWVNRGSATGAVGTDILPTSTFGNFLDSCRAIYLQHTQPDP